jgi:hypothetical protein
MLDERDDARDHELIVEVDNVQTCGGVVGDIVGFNVVESALVTLKQILRERLIDVTPLIQSN